MAPYDRAPMEWVGKLNATGSYDLFVPCVNCNTGLPCKSTAFRLSEVPNMAYHPGCFGCHAKGVPCPDASRTTGALWTLGAPPTLPRPVPVAKDLDAFNAQRSKIRQQHKRRWMDDASEGGEAKKAKVDGSVDGSRPNKVDGFEGSKMNQTRTPEEVETLLAKARAVAKKSSERV